MRRQPKRQPVEHRIMLRAMDIAGMPIIAAIAVSTAAGFLSFLSPCVAPLLPGYIAFVGGGTAGSNRGALPRAIGFVAGFTMLFAALGATAATFSRHLDARRAVIELACGLLVALLGLAMAFDRSIVPRSIAGRLQGSAAGIGAPATAIAAMPVGAAFAVVWTPCIGPALATILTLAAGSSDPARGAMLLVAYGIGLGIPFLIGAIALDRIEPLARWLRSHARVIRIAGGTLLAALGFAIATGLFGNVASRLARIVPDWIG